jgi:hypothetical protein
MSIRDVLNIYRYFNNAFIGEIWGKDNLNTVPLAIISNYICTNKTNGPERPFLLVVMFPVVMFSNTAIHSIHKTFTLIIGRFLTCSH